MEIILPQNRWYGGSPVRIELPDDWKIHVAGMWGDRLPVMTEKEMRDKICRPYGCAPLSRLAEGKKSACILFDDMSRGTPCRETAHILLELLQEAGILKENIIFLCAGGMHSPLERDDFVKKLGADIVAEYGVYNHNPYDNLVYVGTTKRGTRVEINSEFMRYDLKLGIGSVAPHPMAGFGGGCKIILPGIAGIDSVVQNHKIWYDKNPMESGMTYSQCHGNMKNCDMREDAQEAAAMAGFDFKVDLLLNSSCEPVDLFCGQPEAEYEAAVSRGFEVYGMDSFPRVDVCVVNANAKANEAGMAVSAAIDCTAAGGDIVLINFSPSGCVNHYLFSMWGRYTGARMCGGEAGRLPAGIRKLIIFSPFKQYNAMGAYADRTQVVWAETWEAVMRELADRREETSAAVIKEAQISMFYDEEKIKTVN